MRRTSGVIVMMTAKEREAVKRVATARGISMAAMIRQLVLAQVNKHSKVA